MPLYEYACLKCGRHTERIEKFSGPHLGKCPHCGGRVEQVISAPAIQFKGSGWYVTDYGRSSSAGTAERKNGSDHAESSESKTETKSAEAAKDNKGGEKKAAAKKK